MRYNGNAEDAFYRFITLIYFVVLYILNKREVRNV